MSKINPTITLSPLDGRYRTPTAPLVEFLSEAGLNRERIAIEIEWIILLTNGYKANSYQPVLPGLESLREAQIEYLRSLVSSFDENAIQELAEIEGSTHHDVKAVEYYIDRRLNNAPQNVADQPSLSKLQALVHFGCTSEDINNIAYARAIKSSINNVWLPRLRDLVALLTQMSRTYRNLPLLAMTHGQPATPTTLGKEFAVYVYRLNRQLKHLENQEFLGKWNGATGTFGASLAANQHVDWIDLSRFFVNERMGLDWNPLTTQIESHDWQAELYSIVSHTNRILHNLAVDMWLYISRGVFTQVPVAGATGSSTMPHKVNPIRFENAEANLEISCSLLDSLGATLVESRWQRDLTDSSTQRNIGVGLGHSLVAIDNLLTGLRGTHPNIELLTEELENNWEVLGEPIQTAMRAAALESRPGMEQPYEQVKALMRGKSISKSQVEAFIQKLDLDPQVKQYISQLSPVTYIGLADKLVDFEG